VSKYFSWSRRERYRGRQWDWWEKELVFASGLSILETSDLPAGWAGLSAGTTTCACGTLPREEI
jgi:hypothetical protein